MNKLFQLAIGCVTICFAVFSLGGCVKDTYRRTYKIYTPVYKTLSEVRASMKSSAAQPLLTTGKIYVAGNYILLNEQNKGIHIIDNTNPSAPKNVSFVPIPGNIDMAVKGNYLFADSYSDIAVLDVSDPANIRPVAFLNNVLQDRDRYWYSNQTNPDSIKVLVDYLVKDTTVDPRIHDAWLSACPNCYSQFSGGVYNDASAKSTGTAGSMARFGIVNDYLYAVSSSQLISINISAPAAPKQTARQNLAWNIETIYPFRDKLFIGSNQGVYIFDLVNPASPVRQSQFTHTSSCDPVIADGNYAYVTLRSGNSCGGILNEMDVIDISNLSVPALKKTYKMSNPYGLSKDAGKLFVCDGKEGLKIFDAADPNNIRLVDHITGMETYDVIAFGGNAILVAKDGLYQYDYSGTSIRQISKISISN